MPTEPGGVPEPAVPEPAGRRWLRAFGHFWWAFLVGDTPELLAGAVVAVGVAALVCQVGGAHAAGALLLPVLVAAVLSVSVWRAATRR